MARARSINVRVPKEMEDRARASAPELLGDLELAMLVRTGLAMLAGDDLDAAVHSARAARQKPGRKRKHPLPAGQAA